LILITDATSFTGRALTKHLVNEGQEICCLLQPSRRAQRLPTGIRCNTIAASMTDLPALRTSLQDVAAVVHSVEDTKLAEDGAADDHIASTRALIEAMDEVGVQRLIYVSLVGADRNSAYPNLRTRGEVEALLKSSDLDVTVIQPTLTYGTEDFFTNIVAMTAKTIPFVLPIPNTGMARFQPLCVDDLAKCIRLSIERQDLGGQTLSIGGPEYFTYPQMVSFVLAAMGTRRRFIQIQMGLAHGVSGVLERMVPQNPLPLWLLNLLDAGLATELRAIPAQFGFEPGRFAQRIQYLKNRRGWRRQMLRYVLRGQ